MNIRTKRKLKAAAQETAEQIGAIIVALAVFAGLAKGIELLHYLWGTPIGFVLIGLSIFAAWFSFNFYTKS